MKNLLALVAASVLVSPVSAQTVTNCDRWEANAQNLAEPWENNSRTFANGEVRLAVLDTLEPAAGAFHLLVLSPPYSELGDRQCRVVSATPGGIGFAGILFDDMTAGYDPETGLGLDLPVVVYLPETADFQTVGLGLTINQATGDIGAKIYPVD